MTHAHVHATLEDFASSTRGFFCLADPLVCSVCSLQARPVESLQACSLRFSAHPAFTMEELRALDSLG